MEKIIKSDSLLIYFLIALFFMETIFRLLIFENFHFFDFVRTFVFLISLAFLMFLLCSFFQGKVSYILSVTFLAIIALFYSSQLIYFKFFRTFYTIYSAKNGAQVWEFWKDIAAVLWKHSLSILLLFLPVFLLIFFGKNLLYFKKIDWFNRITLVIGIALTQIAGISTVYAEGKEIHSAYDLYFENSYPLLSVERLGLITTMRLDLQRQITGWSPAVNVSAPIDPEPEPKPEPDQKAPSDGEPKNPEPEKPIEYNTMTIEFDHLIANEDNQTVKEMHKYFQSIKPTEKNEFTGKYKDYNLIFITAEAFSSFAVHKEITPTLYQMVNEGYNFTNFYTPVWGVSTSDGEYVACTGLIPKAGVWSFRESGKNDLPFVMGNQLKKIGYKTLAYHNHTYTYYGRDISHPNMGYVYKGVGNGLQVKKTWPESDLEMMEVTIPEYIDSQPFHAYYMTVSGHLQYNFTGNYIAWKNRKYVEDLPYSEQAKAYLATQIELDRALKYLLEQLEKAGIAEKTLIALSADHYPYGLEPETIDELAGHSVERNFELYKNTFILYTKEMEPKTITKPASSLDIIPTLSNLLGLEFDSRLLIGRDIFSNSDPLVIFQNRSFITEKGSYNAVTKKFIPTDGETVEENYIKSMSSIIQNKFYYSAKLLETDYYRKTFRK